MIDYDPQMNVSQFSHAGYGCCLRYAFVTRFVFSSRILHFYLSPGKCKRSYCFAVNVYSELTDKHLQMQTVTFSVDTTAPRGPQATIKDACNALTLPNVQRFVESS